MPLHARRGAGALLYLVVMVSALGIGALQMFRVNAGFLTNYGADVIGTAWFYAMFRQGRTVFTRGRRLPPGTVAGLVLTGCVGTEYAQRLRLFPGVFDPFDLLAFAVSVFACLALDRWSADRRHVSGNEPAINTMVQ
jgi:hypothetical protein